MAVALIVLALSLPVSLAIVVVFCWYVIKLIDKDRVVQVQERVLDKPVFAPQLSLDEINPLENEDVPLDQFQPNHNKPINLKFETDKDEYTEQGNDE